MSKRDYDTAPVTEQLGLGGVIAGLVGDLEDLRAGRITVSDAVARSLLAKQIFNGVRIYLNGSRLLSDAATPIAGRQAERSEAATPASQSPGTNPIQDVEGEQG